MDRLLATGNTAFAVSGSGTSHLTVTATGPRELFTLQEDFVQFLKTVSFESNDQAPFIVRNITLVVQEFPTETSPPSLPAVIPVVFIPVNDRPVIVSTERSQATLTDYLVVEMNEGFYPSFLLSESDVQDVDRASPIAPDFIGLAITAYTGSDSGSWMVWINTTWLPLSSVSECSPWLISSDARVRFVPNPDPSKADSQASLLYRAWDGTPVLDECTNNTRWFSDQSALSAENETFTYDVVYLNRAPFVQAGLEQYALPSIEEDVSVDSNDGVMVSNVTTAVGDDSDDLYLGLAVISADFANGVWQYRAGGGSWTDFPTQLSRESALLLASNSQVRFLPNRDYFGSADFSALIWDMSDSNTNTTTSDPYTGAFSSDYLAVSVNITSVNDRPVIELGNQTVAYTEEGPVIQIFRDLRIQDLDSLELAWARVLLECPLCLQGEASGDISASGVILTPTLTDIVLARHAPPNFLVTVERSDLMGVELRVRAVAGGDSSLEAFAGYLESLYFTSIDREPSNTPRGVSLIVSDGVDQSAPATLTITVNLINDEPPALTLPYTTTTWVEDSGPLQLFSSPVEITDPDDNSLFLLQWATLELISHDPSYETLEINCSSIGLICNFYNGTLTLTGSQSVATYEQALSEVFYVNTNPEPLNYLREVYVSVFDGLFSSQPRRLLIEIELINDQLPVIVLAQEEVVFQEPDTNPITTTVRVAPGATITDSDSGIFPLHSATLTILDPQNDEKEGLQLPEGQAQVEVAYSGLNRHSLSLSYQGGIPLLSLQDALQMVEYFNTVEQTYPVNRSIEIVLYDNLTWSGVQMSSPVQVTVQYIPVDDLPEVRLRDDILLYSEGQLPVQLHVAADAEVVDVDSAEISGLIIRLTANSTIDISQDSLQVNLTGFESRISLDPSSSVLMIELTGAASLYDYTSVLRTLTYEHLESIGDPDTGTRTITATPFSSFGDLGVSDSVLIAFTAVNNAPVIDLNGDLVPGLDNTVIFQEESIEPVRLVDPRVSIVDVDNEELSYMKIVLLNALDGDLEYIAVDSIPIILDVVQQDRAVIELRGQPSPISNFLAVLLNLTYHNLVDEPNTMTNRRISVEVNDGESSGFAYIEVIIAPRNDAPQLTITDSMVVYVEEEDAVPIAAAAQVFDPDSFLIEYRVRPLAAFPGDVITGPELALAPSMGGVYIAAFNATTPEDVAAFIQQIRFYNEDPEPVTGEREFCISVRDEEMATSPEACVIVNVLAMNDNEPQFVGPFQANVLENQANVLVTQIEAADADSVNMNVTLVYSITAGDDCLLDTTGSGSGSGPLLPEEVGPCRFEIDPLTGEITTTSDAPDREVRNSYTLTVSVSDGVFTSNAELVISINDQIDEVPVFVPDYYEVTIPVGAQPGYEIVQLIVLDPDLNDDFSVFQVSMNPTSGRDIFVLDTFPGRILLNRPDIELDPSIPQYTLTFEASDSSFNLSPSPATLVVNVILNQEPPVFGMQNYSAMVSEVASDGYTVLTVTATDIDPGYHGDFTFSIPDAVPFVVDPQSGVITVADSIMINFEAISEYVFSVVATDTGRPPMSSSAEVRVTVINANDNAPVFDAANYEVEVCEGAPAGYPILQVAASDEDGSLLSYSLIEMGGCSACVEVDSLTAELTVVRELDFEQQPSFSFSILATDGIFFADTVVTINVLNDNEAAPEFKFESLIIEIPETLDPGSLLPFPMSYIPLASDTDTCNIDQCNGTTITSNETCGLGSMLQYSITSGNEEGRFAIDPSTGLISISQSLDFDTGAHREFNLSLFVWDGQLGDTAYLVIIVTDINDNLPEFQNDSYSVMIPENTPVGDTVISVLAVDMDPTDVLQYSLIAEENPGFFSINEDGEVAVIAPLDFESMPQYNLIVAVTDRPTIANASAILTTLTIYITDVNDVVPQFTEAEYAFTILENSPPGPIGTVQALDQDPANVYLRFSIINIEPPSPDGAFVIASESGLLESNATFDRESQSVYLVTVQVVDNGIPPLSSSALVRVEIVDVNEFPPQFSDNIPSSINISESTSTGTLILILSAFDLDNTAPANAGLEFRILGDESSSPFMISQIDSQTVQLLLSQELDYEMVTQYSLAIQVSDMVNTTEGLPLSSVTVIEVTVIDENDNAPEFDQLEYSAEISEHSTVGTSVFQAVAFDRDTTGANAIINYAIVDSDSQDFPFFIDPLSGLITVANSVLLDLELNGRRFILTVTASNPNTNLQSSATLVVDLLDINDNAPVFSASDFTFSITEDFTTVVEAESSGGIPFSGLGSGTFFSLVSTITAFDLDEGVNAELRYSLVTGSEQFYIDSVSGELYATVTLDRELQDSYTFEVSVMDRGTPPLESRVLVQVIVTDINDNTPRFEQDSYTAEILENEPANVDVLPVSASDFDLGENADIQFSILDSSVPFQIHPQSGMIQTTRPLDRENQASWSFSVQATDGQFSSTADVIITVADENDHPPSISPQQINRNLTENVAIGTVIESFVITDEDSGINAESTVFLRSSTDLFAIDNNGVLSVAGLIDYELMQEVSLEVVVRNVAPPNREATAQIAIAVVNENDNPPVVHFGTNSVEYDELVQRTVPLNLGITIVDNDGRGVTRLVDGIVEFLNVDVSEPSFAYEPVTDGIYAPDFQCPLEVNKELKFRSCGVPDVTVLTRFTQGVLILQGGLTVGQSVVRDSIIFDASQQQYATYIGDVGTLVSSGLTISTWVWSEPTAPSEPRAILSKVSSSQLLYGLVCNPDGSLEFQYTSEGSARNATFARGCSALEGAWHHLGVVVDNSDSSQWRLYIFINGEEFASADIGQPFDDNGGVFIGASKASLNSATENFFNGRLHMLTVGLSSSNINQLNCVTGCGLVLISTLTSSPLTHYYDFSQRALIVEGTQPIGPYEDFLNSLVIVLPFTEPRVSSYILSYTVQDTVFNCLPVFVDVIVIPSNDFQPQLSLNGATSIDYSTTFTEEEGPVPIVNQTSLYLTDMDLIEFEYVVTARILDPLQPHTEEILAVHNIPEGMNVTYDSSHTLTLTGLLPLPMFEAVLRTLTYDNTADEPVGFMRQIMVTVSDPPLPDISALSDISIIYVNDPPELVMVSSPIEYSEGDGAVAILLSAAVSDSDDSTIVSATVTFNAPDAPMEILAVSVANTAIAAVYNPTSATLTLTGEDTLENYTAVLLSITYEHIGVGDPSPGTRVFSFVLSDGEIEGEPEVVMLFIAAVNDGPVVYLNGTQLNYRVAFVEDSDEIVGIVSPDATIMDIDGDSLVSLSVNLTNPAQEQERIVVTTPASGGIEAVYLSDSHVELRPASGISASLSEFETVLRTVQYQNTAEEPTPGIRLVTFTAYDGEDPSQPAATEITVISVNDRPVLDLDTETTGTGFAAQGFVEGGSPVYITGRSVSLTDNDVDAAVQMLTITIQSALDGLDEKIESTDPNATLPLPANGQSVTYVMVFDDEPLADVATLLTTLQYRNARVEPTPGQRVVSIAISDGTEFSNTAIVTLEVIGLNENTPQFTQDNYPFTIQESLAPPISVGSVIAIDIDDGIDGVVSYEIAASAPLEGLTHFIIDETTGEISTTVTLDREMIELYTLTISATDGGLPQRTATATVNIQVMDINDAPPMFSPDNNFTITVLESREEGFIIETILVMNPDLGEGGFSIIESQSPDIPFTVNIRSGDIAVAGNLDVDTQTPEGCNNDEVYMMDVVASDFLNSGLSSEASFTIRVVDVNDNAPEFVSDSAFTVMEESQSLYAFTVSAVDRDCTSNGEITYSFQNNSYPFIIDPVTGDVSSVQPLDHEERDYYEFTVLATDGGMPRHSASATVTLSVLDVNDNPPVFSETPYEVVLEENVGGNLVQVQARDADTAPNAAVLYYLDPSTSLFTINNITGNIAFADGQSLDFEVQSSLTFFVFAEDSGSPALTGTGTVVVQVIDVNDNAPSLQPLSQQAEVPENQPGVLLTTFTGTDADSGENGEVFFRLLNHNDQFAIDQITGDLTAVSSLDFETQCYYVLYVEAYDGGIPSLNSSMAYAFEVFVLPVEDIPPMFTFDSQSSSSYQTSVPENSPRNTVVIQVTAEDGDLDECNDIGGVGSGSGSGLRPDLLKVTYSLLEPSALFVIDESNGFISLLDIPDFEQTQQHVLTVLATDPVGLQAQATVTVNVLDVNDHIPEFDQPLYEAVVTENTAVGSSVLQVSAIDEDSLDQGRLSFSLSGSPEFFSINRTDGILYVADSINFESIGSIVTFLAVVTDSALNENSVPVTITIADSNDLPPVINTQPQILIFTEGQVSLQPFPTMSISDPDSFQLLCSASVALDSPEQTNSVEQCACTDSQNASSCSVGCLEFIQLSPGLFPGSVQQLQQGFELVLEGNYSIQDYEAALEGIEYVNVIYNPMPQPRTVSVSVFDCQLASNTFIQTIDIQPLNVFPPMLDLNGDAPGIDYQTSFTERGNAVAIVSDNVSISDQDTARSDQLLTSIDIRLVNQYDGDWESIYLPPGSQLPSGIAANGDRTYITLSGVASLEYYEDSLKLLRYSNLASEPDPSPREVEFIAHEFFLSSQPASTDITIVTINDFPPTVIANPPNVNYITTYVEGSAGVGVVSSDVEIVDEDSTNDSVIEMQVYVLNPTPEDRLYLSNSPPSLLQFTTIQETSFSFSGSAPRSDYETVLRSIRYQYSGDEFDFIFPPRVIFIQIADHSLSGFTVVKMEFSPVNDNLPEFTEDSVTVSVAENTTVGAEVYQLEYTDADTFSPTEVNFRIVGGNAFFSIASKSGIITLQERLDFETTPMHSFTVELRDDGHVDSSASTSIVVTIVVTDQNDHVPMFTQEVYNATINEGAPLGSSVLQVFADDRDSQTHSVLEFEVVNTNDFRIDSNGIIYTVTDLDQEDVPSYQFLVSVRNPGDIASDTAQVFVTVLDINDHAPVITLSPNVASLQEPETLVSLSSSLTITDRDTNPSLDYAIVEVLEGAPGVLIVTLSLPEIVVSGNGSSALVFSGESQSLSNYEQILRRVVYVDAEEEPLPIAREIAYQVGSDPAMSISLNYTLSETTSNVAVFQVSVELINDQSPVIQLDTRGTTNLTLPECTAEGSYSTMFTENSSPALLSHSSLTITDADSGETTIYWASVQLLNAAEDDLLGYQYSGAVTLNTTASSDTRLWLQGPASIAEFEAALRTVTYQSSSQEPTGFRQVEFVVSDGELTSSQALACVELVEINDPPELRLGLDGSVDVMLMYTEGQTQLLLLAPDLEITGGLLNHMFDMLRKHEV